MASPIPLRTSYPFFLYSWDLQVNERQGELICHAKHTFANVYYVQQYCVYGICANFINMCISVLLESLLLLLFVVDDDDVSVLFIKTRFLSFHFITLFDFAYMGPFYVFPSNFNSKLRIHAILTFCVCVCACLYRVNTHHEFFSIHCVYRSFPITHNNSCCYFFY